MERSGTADTWLDLPPTSPQTRWALAVAAVALTGFAAVVPIADTPLTQLNAFFPSLDAIVFVSDLVTAVLLYAQFWISRLSALLALATGYLFTALIVIPHALTFAGAFSPTGLGANIQTGSWLFIFWHIGFSAGLLAYAVLEQKWFALHVPQVWVLPAVWCSAAGVVGLVGALTWLATAGVTALPPIILNDQRHISPIVVYPISFAMLIALAALLLLLRRRRSVLGLWLMVVALVAILELAFSGLLPSIRFSAGFYAGRTFSLLTASIVLIVMLAETTVLYMQLARSNALLRREQNNKLMTMEAMASSIVHEIRQPLTGIALYGGAGLSVLKQSPPDLQMLESTLSDIIDASHRANAVLEGVRALFAKDELHKAPIDMNDLIAEVVGILQPEFDSHKIVTSLTLDSSLSPVFGHRAQLQEVMINLIKNALEAMALADGLRVLKIRTEATARGAAVSVEDTGPGVSPENADGLFEAFVSTKSNGMGLGLAICRMIVERHEGKLSFSAANPRGAIFTVVLPQSRLAH